MGAALLLWALTLLSVTTSVVPEPHYLVVFPALIRYPDNEKFCVLLRSLPETVHLEVMLEMKSGNHTLVEKNVEKPHHFECITFQVPCFTPKEAEEDEIAEEVAHVHVHIHKGDSVSFEGRKKVLVRRATTRLIIEPDKPFYKPGETVRFRILRLDEDFKAVKKNITLVLLTDPNENRIGQWKNVETQQGIAEFSFPLASEAVQGDYAIQVRDVEDYPQKRHFSVEEYVLPKFKVSFEVPLLVTTSDKEIRIKMMGKYTYGKGVRGKVRLRLTRDVSFYFFEEAQNGTLIGIEKEYTAQTDKTGCAFITIDAADINLPQKGYADSIDLSAELEEEGTGIIKTGRVTISLVTKAVEVSFINLNPFYKHGFPYTGKMSCGVNSAPVKNQTIYLTVDVNDVETHFPYTTDENGEVHFTLDTAGWNEALVSLRVCQEVYGSLQVKVYGAPSRVASGEGQGRYSIVNVSSEDAEGLEIVRREAFTWLKPFYSESNSFLEIQHVEEELPCGKDQEVRVDYILDRKELAPNADHVDFYYLVVSKGNIVLSGEKQVPIGHDETLKGTFSLILPTSSELAPLARLLLYAVFEDGEVAADVDVFTIEKCFRHQVTVDFSEKENVPGSTVKLQVEAAPGALCSLQALDKSVILKKDLTLTAEEVYDAIPYYESIDTVGTRGFDYHLEDFEPYPCLPSEHPQQHGQRRKRTLIGPWYESQADVYNLIKQLRMKVITNTQVKRPVTCAPLPERRILKLDARTELVPEPLNEPVQTMAENVPQPLGSEAKKEEKAKPRTHFPETWIWDLVPVNEEGKASCSLTVPDTITEWQANAFCVADLGFGLAEPATFLVFKPFFVDLTMPYSVVRGETFELKATVFNYLKECMQMIVHLVESQQVTVESCPTCRDIICLCEDDAHTISWNVTATHLGRVELSVTTEAQETAHLCGNKISTMPERGRSDTVVKSLLVKPEGILEEETHNVFLCSSGDPVLEEVPLTLPAAIIEDTSRATASVIGDILGPALQHISGLLQMPFGCGEQNMVKFVPNIFVLRYLEATKQATPEIQAKAVEYMKSGYQRQLFYKHDDGSYSAFGKEDAEGNTWLTAFVARAFGQAKSYVFIDDKHIHDAVHWLEEHQLPSGCFQNVGRLFNNAVKGGVDDDFSLTAYVTAALLELHLHHNGTMVEDALACLKRNLSFVNGTYPKVLSAYTFTLAGDMEMRQQLLRDLKEHPDEDENVLEEAETAAYMLLALLSKPEVSAEDIKEAFQVVRALIKQQNPYGGFSSTQDTVVALKALSRYAALTYKVNKGVKVLVKSATGFQHEFHVDQGNKLLLQEAPLPEVPGQYTVEVSGSGCAYVQTTLRYNHPPEKTDAFTLIVETSPKECNRTSRKYFDIHLQVSYIGERESSNMALIEVNLVSGFIPVKKSVKRLVGKLGVKKVEFDPDKISIYLDQLDKNVRNYHFSVEQEVEVIDLKPATVTVYDYYHPEDYAEAEYNAPCSTESTKQDIH